MQIKHSKYRNTGLIYELLIKQITADTLKGTPSPAIKVLKKYFGGKSALANEFKLYEYVLKNGGVSQQKAETIINTILELSRRLDRASLKNQKYELIGELKEHYDLDKLFSKKIKEYKPLAALYCLLEAQNNDEIVDPEDLVTNKTTLLEHLTYRKQNEEDVRDTLIEEYDKHDKDVKLIAYKIMLKNFNNSYKDFSPKQKQVLKEFISSVSISDELKEYVRKQFKEISAEIDTLSEKVQDKVTKIKLKEILTNIPEVDKHTRLQESNLSLLLQYYDLIDQIKTLNTLQTNK